MLWYLSAELGQQIDVLGLPPEVGDDYLYICQNLIPWRLKHLGEIAARPI